MHDNFVEAILSGRVSAAIPEWILLILEVLFGLGAALLLQRFAPWLQILTFFGLFCLLIIVQWIMLGLFYTYFDALVPLVGLALHAIGERLLERKAPHPSAA